MQALFEVFPQAAVMERDLFRRLLRVNIRRSSGKRQNFYEYVFFLALPGSPIVRKLRIRIEPVTSNRILKNRADGLVS